MNIYYVVRKLLNLYQISSQANFTLIWFLYKKLCSKDWTYIKFHHNQTLNDRHFSLDYRNWAYNISLERSWSLGSNASKNSNYVIFLSKIIAKRVNMYQISTQAFFLFKLMIVIDAYRIILVIIFICRSVSILNFSSEIFFRDKLER